MGVLVPVRFKSLLLRGEVQNSLWVLLGQVARVGFQFLAFLLVAHTLGPEGFGTFSGILGLAVFLGLFVELGGYNLIIRDIQQGISERQALGKSLSLSFILLVPVLALSVSLKGLLFPNVSWITILTLVLSTIVGSRVYLLGAGVWVGKGRFKVLALFDAFAGVALFLSALVLSKFKGNIEVWALLYAFQSMVVSGLSLVSLTLQYGPPLLDWKGIGARFREGVAFTLGEVAKTGGENLDKTILLRMAGPEAAGLYTIAWRFYQILLLPFSAVMTSLYPRFFNVDFSERALSKVLRWATVYGLGGLLGLPAFSYFLPHLLGIEFKESGRVLRLLGVAFLFQSLSWPLTFSLYGMERQRQVASAYVMYSFVLLALNAILAPRVGALAAAWAMVVANGLALATLTAMVARQRRMR